MCPEPEFGTRSIARHLIRAGVQIGRATVQRVVREFGMPRFLITDHGCQSRQQFSDTIEALSIAHVCGRVRSAGFNGKVERLFRTLRQWHRLSVLPLSLRGFQRRLDRFRAWHNIARPHQSLGVLTPEEA